MRRNTLVIASVGIAVVLGGALTVGIAVPGFLESRARAWVDENAPKKLDAKVAFEGLDVSLLANFPSATVHVTGLTLDGQGPFEGVQLASIPDLRVRVGLLSLLGDGPIAVRGVALTQPSLNLDVDPEGRANWDIVKDDGSGEAASYDLDLDAIGVTDGTLAYTNRESGSQLLLRDIEHTSSGAADEVLVRLATHTTIAGMTFESGGVAWLNEVKLDATAAVDYAQATGGITLGENQIALNDLVLTAVGSLVPQGEDWTVDAKVNAVDTAFKSVLSLVPSAYSANFADVDAAGTLALEGTVKGLYSSSEDHLPALDFAMQIADGRFAYPGLPQSVQDIAADVLITHLEGPLDGTIVDVKTFTLTTGGAPFGGRIRVEHPATDPDLDVSVKGQLDLGALRAALPEDGTSYSGIVNADVDFGGRMSAFQASDVDKVRASGTLKFEDVRYASPDWPVPFDFSVLDVSFDRDQATIEAVKVTFGESDLEGKGQLGGLIPYVLADGTLKGTFQARGKRLDLAPFEGSDDPAEPASDEVLVAVPTNLDLAIDAAWDRVDAMGHQLEEVKGTLVVKDGSVRMDPLDLKLLGGHVTLTGLYAAPTADKADVEMTVALAGFDVGKTVEAFTTLSRIIPVAQGAKGTFDSGFELRTSLARDGTPDLSILFSKGKIKTKGVTLAPEVFTKISQLLKDPKLSVLALDSGQLFYELREGKLLLEPLAALLGGTPATLSGGAGVLDKTMDLAVDLKLPAAALAGAAFVGGKALVGDEIPVRVLLQGAWADPKVSAALGEGTVKGAVQAVVADAVGDLLDKARAQGDALVAKAETGAAALKAEAKKAGDKLRSEAKAQGAKLVKEAKGNPIQEIAAKEAAKKLDSEADKGAKKLDKEAAAKADKMVAEAKTKRDELIATAEAKTTP